MRVDATTANPAGDGFLAAARRSARVGQSRPVNRLLGRDGWRPRRAPRRPRRAVSAAKSPRFIGRAEGLLGFQPSKPVFAGRKPSIGPQLAVKRPTNSLFPQRHQVVVEVAAAAAGDLVEWHAAVLRVRANTPPQGPGRLGSAGSRCRLGLIGAVRQAAPGRLVVEIGMVDLVKPGELGGYFQAQRSDGG